MCGFNPLQLRKVNFTFSKLALEGLCNMPLYLLRSPVETLPLLCMQVLPLPTSGSELPSLECLTRPLAKDGPQYSPAEFSRLEEGSALQAE